MPEFTLLPFDLWIASALTCLLIREALILTLPKHLAGPGGRFIDTGPE